MKELKCDLIVGPITTVEKEDETVYSVPLSGKNESAEVKLTLKFRDRVDMVDHGVDVVGSRKVVVLSQANTELTDFGE